MKRSRSQIAKKTLKGTTLETRSISDRLPVQLPSIRLRIRPNAYATETPAATLARWANELTQRLGFHLCI